MFNLPQTRIIFTPHHFMIVLYQLNLGKISFLIVLYPMTSYEYDRGKNENKIIFWRKLK